MWEFITTLLKSDAGSFAFVIGFMFLAGWLIHTITKHTTKWSCEMGKVEKIEGSIDSIKSDIVYIKGMMSVLQTNTPNALVQSHSPISLNRLGEEIATKMNIRDLIAANWDKINSYISSNASSKNAYDIQQFCIETATVSIDKFFCLEDINKIKSFAFEAGQNLAYYGGMIGIIIRDKYFEVNKIDIAEVDHHDPTKH